MIKEIDIGKILKQTTASFNCQHLQDDFILTQHF